MPATVSGCRGSLMSLRVRISRSGPRAVRRDALQLVDALAPGQEGLFGHGQGRDLGQSGARVVQPAVSPQLVAENPKISSHLIGCPQGDSGPPIRHPGRAVGPLTCRSWRRYAPRPDRGLDLRGAQRKSVRMDDLAVRQAVEFAHRHTDRSSDRPGRESVKPHWPRYDGLQCH